MGKLGLRDVPFGEILKWWGEYGSKKFRWLSHVARSAFGHPASAAGIERDFSMAGQMLSPRRSRLDAVYAEVLMYLNLNFDDIPDFIPGFKAKYDDSMHLPQRVSGIDDMDTSVTPTAEELARDEAEKMRASRRDPLGEAVGRLTKGEDAGAGGAKEREEDGKDTGGEGSAAQAADGNDYDPNLSEMHEETGVGAEEVYGDEIAFEVID